MGKDSRPYQGPPGTPLEKGSQPNSGYVPARPGKTPAAWIDGSGRGITSQPPPPVVRISGDK